MFDFGPYPLDVERHVGGDADAALTMATAMVAGYTRGVGFDQYGDLQRDASGQVVYRDLAAVVVAVAGRLKVNPTGLRRATTAGPFTEDIAGWQGFTLAEQTIMNRYRVRTL